MGLEIKEEENGFREKIIRRVFWFFKFVRWMYLKVFKFLGECMNKVDAKRV